MRIHLVAGIAAIVAGMIFRVGADEWRWLIVAIALVVAGEAFNTAIERTCDAIGGRSEAIRQAKDVAAGGVLVLAITAALIGLAVFIPHLMALERNRGPRLPLCSVF